MYRWLTLLWVMSWTALGAQAQTQITFSPAELALSVGETAIVEVVVSDVPAPGLAAYQTTLTFTPGKIEILNPNEAFRAAGITPFAPLGGNPFCPAVRGTATCPDPAWFLTSTGRTADAVPDTIDNTAGKIEFGFGTRGASAPPTGGGTIALIEVVGTADGLTTVTLDEVILATNDEPPRELPFTAGTLSVRVGDVPPPNNMPVLDPIDDQPVSEGGNLSIPLSATDEDGDSLSFSTTGLPGFCSLTDGGDGSGSLDCTPGFEDAGIYPITVTVTDDGNPSLSDDDPFTLTVMNVNLPPTLTPINDESMLEGGNLTIPLSAADVDGDGLTFSTSGLPGFCSLTDGGDGSGSLDCSPGFDDAGNYPITVTVTDDGNPNLPDDETFTLTVSDVNQPPEILEGNCGPVAEGESLSFPWSATDADGDGLTFSTSGLPSFCSLTDFGDGTASLDCAPGFDDADSYTVTVTVTDDGSPNMADEVTCTLTVTTVNQPPELTAIEDQSVAEGENLSIPLLATDDDGNSLTFNTTGLPGFCSLTDGGDGTGSLDCSPGVEDAGIYFVTVMVTDDGSPNLADEQTFDLEVRDTNRRPLADAGDDTNVPTGAQVTLDGSNSSDPDADLLLFSWRFDTVPTGSALTDADLSNAATPESGFTPDVGGEYVLELAVSDDALSDTATVRITASTDNVPPNAGAGNDQDVSTLQPVTLDGTGSDDPDQGPQDLSFNWFFAAVPAGSMLADDQLVGSDTATPVFTSDVDGTYRLVLEVSDGAETRQDTVDIRATTLNVPPTADAGADIAIAETDIPVVLNGSNSIDPDNLPQLLSFEWRFVFVPPASALTDEDITDDLTATLSFTPDVDGLYLLRLDVSDGAERDFDQVMVEMGDVPETPVGPFGRGKQTLVNLGWSGSEAATEFVIFRRLDSEIDFTEVGRVPIHVFVDHLPVGTLSAEYFVVAENKFGASGDSEIVTVAPALRGR